jgi:hypothetical protein
VAEHIRRLYHKEPQSKRKKVKVALRSWYSLKRRGAFWTTDEIATIIDLNERLQKRKLNITTKQFTDLFWQTGGKCQITDQFFGRKPDFDVGIQRWGSKWRLGLMPLVVTFNRHKAHYDNSSRAPQSLVEELRNQIASAVYDRLRPIAPSVVRVRDLSNGITISLNIFGMRWDQPEKKREKDGTRSRMIFSHSLRCQTTIDERAAEIEVHCNGRRKQIPFADPNCIEAAVDVTVDYYRLGLADRAYDALACWDRHRDHLYTKSHESLLLANGK